MASTDIFLCRKNGRFFKYDAVEAVSLTGAIETYSGVTGVSSTGIVTIPGAVIYDSTPVTFSQITGGSSVTVGLQYYAVESSGSTCKLAATVGGSPISLGSNITDGAVFVVSNEIRVWSAEYRDIFNNTTTVYPDVTVAGTLSTSNTYTAAIAALPGTLVGQSVANVGLSGEWGLAGGDVTTSISDEIKHQPLRQTMLPRTHWKFDMGSSVSPRYLYAEWQTGDAVTPNPPNTI